MWFYYVFYKRVTPLKNKSPLLKEVTRFFRKAGELARDARRMI
jgi:hypothetical protein